MGGLKAVISIIFPPTGRIPPLFSREAQRPNHNIIDWECSGQHSAASPWEQGTLPPTHQHPLSPVLPHHRLLHCVLLKLPDWDYSILMSIANLLPDSDRFHLPPIALDTAASSQILARGVCVWLHFSTRKVSQPRKCAPNGGAASPYLHELKCLGEM